MLSNDKHYGIYRGIVADADDPDDLGRVKLIVPQILGQSVTNWAWPVNASISQNKWPYATFTTTQSQYASAPAVEKIITHENTEDSNSIYSSGSKIYVEESGDYFISYSTTFSTTSSSAQTVDIWFKLNGADIPRSSTSFIMSGNPNIRNTSKGGILDLHAGDYVELAFQVTNTNVHVTSVGASGDAPAAAGSVFSIYMVGKWKPQPNTGVWVMFEGGDPNFPLWLGGF